MIEQVVDLILEYKSFVVLAHTNPDADAYGSSCGLALGLQSLEAKVILINEKGSVERYNAIPGVSRVSPNLPELSAEQLVIVCDCGAAERTGDSFVGWLKSSKAVLNIDHHAGNSLFGTVNFVDSAASSTSEMVAKILFLIEERTGKNVVSKDVATALFAGIMADTGSFRYECTSATTYRIAAQLIERGASPYEISSELFSNTKVQALKLQSDALSGIQLLFDGRFAEVIADHEMIKRHAAEVEDSDSLAERARDVRGVLVSALYKQDGALWRVSLRSRSPKYDVSAVAVSFGGGGHKVAAAFRSKLGFQELQTTLRERVQTILN